MTSYVHFLASNAENEYGFQADLKGSIYTKYKLEALKKQKTMFKRRARQSFNAKKSTDITKFLHEINYGDKIAEQLNAVMDNSFHGFTSAAEFSSNAAFSSFAFSSEEEIKKRINFMVSKNSKVLSEAAAVLRNWSTEIDSLIVNMGDYILNLLSKEEDMSAEDKSLVQDYLKLQNNSIIEIPKNASLQARIALEDYARLTQDNELLKAKANMLDAHGGQSASAELVKEFQGLGRFLNMFGGFIGEVAGLVGVYKAMSDPEFKQKIGSIQDVFHTGAQKSMGGFISTSVSIKNDPAFQKFLDSSSKLGTKQTLKEDVNFILSDGYVQGLVGVNIKNSSERKAGVIKKNSYITLDSSGTFSQVIQRVTSQGIVDAKFGNPDYYYNLAAGVPYRRKNDSNKTDARNLTMLWNNYVDLIATGNLIVALMGRMNEMGVSAGDNALVFLLNGKYYGIHSIINKVIDQVDKRGVIKGHQDKAGQALHRRTLAGYNYSFYQRAEERNAAGYKNAAEERSKLVNTALTYAFSTTMKTKIKIDLFSLLK